MRTKRITNARIKGDEVKIAGGIICIQKMKKMNKWKKMKWNEKSNLLYMIGNINSSDPEPFTTYVETGRKLIWKFVLLLYECGLTRSHLFPTNALHARHWHKWCNTGWVIACALHKATAFSAKFCMLFANVSVTMALPRYASITVGKRFHAPQRHAS